MKTIKFLIILSVVFVSACSKERIESDKTTTTSYSSADDFYDMYKQEEQEFIIDTIGTGPIIGKMGTKLYVGKELFMFPDSQDINWPYTIKLIEIYPVKDIILYNLPPIANKSILESSAEIRVRAFKDGQELLLKPQKNYYMELDTMDNLLTDMKVYYGFTNGDIIDWTSDISVVNPSFVLPDLLSSVDNLTYFHSMNVAHMGWVDCGKLLVNSGATTTIKFSAEGNNTENIDIFLVFKNSQSLMQVYNLESYQVPVGEEMTIIAISRDQDKKLVLHNEDITVVNNHQVTLDLKVISESDLLSTLSAL